MAAYSDSTVPGHVVPSSLICCVSPGAGFVEALGSNLGVGGSLLVEYAGCGELWLSWRQDFDTLWLSDSQSSV